MDRNSTSDRLAMLLRDVAELALQAQDRNEFRESALERVCRALAIDAGAMNHTRTGAAITTNTWGVAAQQLQAAHVGYMSEMTTDELHRASTGRFVTDDLVFESRRRESLGLYSEFLRPTGIFRFCVHMWTSPHGCFWIALSRDGHRARYSTHDLAALDAVAPVLAVGEMLHLRSGPAVDAVNLRRDWARTQRITYAEMQVVELLERGLSNREIATVLGRSVNTVRNQANSAFRKANVSNRVELVFLLGHLEDLQQSEEYAAQNSLGRLLRAERDVRCR